MGNLSSENNEALSLAKEAFDLLIKGFSPQTGAALLGGTGIIVTKLIQDYLDDIKTGPQSNRVKYFPKKLDKKRLVEKWKNLVEEVIDEFRWEQEILKHKLNLAEFRPRIFFSVLPESEQWEKSKMSNKKTKDLIVKYIRIGYDSSIEQKSKSRKKKLLSIILPIKNGYRKTFRSMSCLTYDVESLLEEYYVDFHVCVNHSDDNSLYEVTRFAKTVGQSREIPITLYLADKRKNRESFSGGWRKSEVLNVIKDQINGSAFYRNKIEDYSDTQHYLHFGDDDIFIKPGSDVIKNNINLLRSNKELNIISGTYTNEENSGFSAISSVRKHERYVEKVQSASKENKLFNVYGGCMTTTMSRLKKVLKHFGDKFLTSEEGFGEDAFLTLAANDSLCIDFITDDEKKPVSGYLDHLCAYANRKSIVGHREPTNILGYSKRVHRDRKWLDKSVEKFVDFKIKNDPLFTNKSGISGETNIKDKIKLKFNELRKKSFEGIGDSIKASKDLRHILAHCWNHSIREQLKKEDILDFEKTPVKWDTQKTQHQICKDICENKQIADKIRQIISEGTFGKKLVQALRFFDSDPHRAFSGICLMLISSDKRYLYPYILENPYLFHVYTIAEEAYAYIIQFLLLTGTKRIDVCKKFGLNEQRIIPLLNKYPLNLQKIFEKAFPKDFISAQIVPEGSPTPEQNNNIYWCKSASNARESSAIFVYPNPTGNNAKPEKRYFLKYYSIIGHNKFTLDSPRRKVYLNVLGEHVLGTVLAMADPSKNGNNLVLSPVYCLKATLKKKKSVNFRIVETLYPDLKNAMLNYAGPERHGPFDRLMHSLFIQKSLMTKAKSLKSVIMNDNQFLELAGCLAHVLGSTHGLTFGVRAYLNQYYDQSIHEKKLIKGGLNFKLNQLLIEHLDKIRFVIPRSYKNWLQNGMDQPGSIEQFFQNMKERKGKIGLQIETLIRQDGLQLQEVWEELIEESCSMHLKYGALGHQGLYSANLYISYSTKDWEVKKSPGRNYIIAKDKASIRDIYLSDHYRIAMTDPALETGLVLAEIIYNRLAAGVRSRLLGLKAPEIQDRSLSKIMDTFRRIYEKKFKEKVSDGNIYLTKEQKDKSMDSMPNFIKRLSHFTAIWLLTKYHDSEEYNLTDEESQQLIRICVDLLHVGSPLKLNFRD